MRKLLILLVSIFTILTLLACGEVEEKDVSSVETSGEEAGDSDATESTEETEENDSVTYDEVLLDDDVATVLLKGIETESDDIFGDQHNIKLEIENKSDKTIEVQAHEVSIDGLMVDDMVFFSETVSAGKKANGTMNIMALDDELPELNENLEFILKVFDYESFMDISSTDVSIDIK